MAAESVEILKEIKVSATTTLHSLKETLEGMRLELETAQRRNFDSSDFLIDEFRALVAALDRLTGQLARLP